MTETVIPTLSASDRLSSGLIWVSFFSAVLVYLSLWVVSYPVWHLSVSLLTFVLLAVKAEHPMRQIAYILALLLFLVFLQFLFSPMIKSMITRSYREGIIWSEWKYLLLALERFTLPLALVASFQRNLTNPTLITRLTSLLIPLQWIGFNIRKLQMLLILALKFIPGLRREWERFDQLQTFFVSKLPRRSLLQRMIYWRGVLKAMISHTLHQAVITGDLLAIRGMPVQSNSIKLNEIPLPLLIWSLGGLGSLWLEPTIFYAWLGFSVWIVLTILSLQREHIS